VGTEMTYTDATELLVTRAIFRTSLTLATADLVLAESQQVDSMIRKHGLVHVGWLRMGPTDKPLSASDIITQQVTDCLQHSKFLHTFYFPTRDMSEKANQSRNDASVRSCVALVPF
jgi:hypothetical protein